MESVRTIILITGTALSVWLMAYFSSNGPEIHHSGTKDKGGVKVKAPDVSIEAGPEGVKIEAPGVNIEVED